MGGWRASLLILLSAVGADPQEQVPGAIGVDARELTIEGQAWPGEAPPYGRLPARLQARVREGLWDMGLYSAGLSVRFIANCAGIGVTWEQTGTEEVSYNFTSIARSGMDLYVREGDDWLWGGQAAPREGPQQVQVLVEGLDGRPRQYRLYLPLFSSVDNLKIWIFRGKAAPMPAGFMGTQAAPIVFYGTSITHGASASRPGLAYSAIIGRKLDRPFYNLGFSGQGRMDAEVAGLLAELDPAAYVVECTANMSPDEVRARTVPFVQTLRRARPKVPIVLVESPPHHTGKWVASVARQDSLRGAYLQGALRQLAAAGVEGVYFVEGDSLVRQDREGSVDGVHPNDLGMELIAERLMTVLASVIKE